MTVGNRELVDALRKQANGLVDAYNVVDLLRQAMLKAPSAPIQSKAGVASLGFGSSGSNGPNCAPEV